MTRTVINEPYRQYADFIAHIPERDAPQPLHTFCADRNVVSLVAAPDDRKWVVKRFKTPSLLKRLIYTWFTPSKADRTYDYGLRLRGLGFHTPEPVAKIIQTGAGLIAASYAIYDFVDYPTLRDLMKGLDERQTHLLWESFMAYTVSLHEQGVLHRDFNIGNILVETDPQGKPLNFYLIDINRMKFGRGAVPLKEGLKALSCFEVKPELRRMAVTEYAARRNADPEKALAYVQRRRRRRHLRKALCHPLRHLHRG